MKPPILWISFIILYWDLVVDSYWLPASRGTNIWKNSGLRMMGSRAALKSVIQTPIKVGLTGSIGMGKSTVTNQLKRLGFPVFDADAIVHKLYSHGGKAIEPLRTICDSAIVEDAVDRKKLMEAIMEDGSNTLISRIESIVHPLVEEEKFLFYHACKSKSFPIIFYDIPLLFESVLKRQKSDTSNIDGKKYLEFDYIITVTASAETQASRVLNRVGMTRQKLDTILAKQVPDEHKRSNSDFLILTDFPGFSEGRYQLAKTIDALYMSNNELISNTLNDMETTNTGEAVIFTDEFMFDMESLQSYRDQSFWDFVKCKMPSVYNLRSEYVEAFTRFKGDNPFLSHDSSAIDKIVLKHLCTEPRELAYVDEAIQVKENAIQCYDPFLKTGVHAAIAEACRQNQKVGLITRFSIGNATEKLKFRVDTILNYIDIGTTESSIVPYFVLSQLWSISPRRFKLYSSNPAASTIAATLSIVT